jgi:hypothetical protein
LGASPTAPRATEALHNAIKMQKEAMQRIADECRFDPHLKIK